ncbi:MAG: elongation factor P [Planctomycetia bacterium]|nr:elongation factor P [Planctomycetia bacterium]
MIAKEIKRGMIVVYDGAPCMIEGVVVQTPSARGAATLYKFRARNLLTKTKVDFVLKGAESLNEADFQRRAVKYLYADMEKMYFMDEENYEQYELTHDEVGDEKNYLTEDLEGVLVLIYNEMPVGIAVPFTIVLKIVQCDPGVKGNSATSRTKPATLETGLVIQVPEYIEEGTLVKVDSRTGEYLSRA